MMEAPAQRIELVFDLQRFSDPPAVTTVNDNVLTLPPLLGSGQSELQLKDDNGTVYGTQAFQERINGKYKNTLTLTQAGQELAQIDVSALAKYETLSIVGSSTAEITGLKHYANISYLEKNLQSLADGTSFTLGNFTSKDTPLLLTAGEVVADAETFIKTAGGVVGTGDTSRLVTKEGKVTSITYWNAPKFSTFDKNGTETVYRFSGEENCLYATKKGQTVKYFSSNERGRLAPDAVTAQEGADVVAMDDGTVLSPFLAEGTWESLPDGVGGIEATSGGVTVDGAAFEHIYAERAGTSWTNVKGNGGGETPGTITGLKNGTTVAGADGSVRDALSGGSMAVDVGRLILTAGTFDEAKGRVSIQAGENATVTLQGVASYGAGAKGSCVISDSGETSLFLNKGSITLPKGKTVEVPGNVCTATEEGTKIDYADGKTVLTEGAVLLEYGNSIFVKETSCRSEKDGTILTINKEKDMAELTVGEVSVGRGEKLLVSEQTYTAGDSGAALALTEGGAQLTKGAVVLGAGQTILVKGKTYTAAQNGTKLARNDEDQAELTEGKVLLTEGSEILVQGATCKAGKNGTALTINEGIAELTEGKVTLTEGGEILVRGTTCKAGAGGAALTINEEEGLAELTAGEVSVGSGKSLLVQGQTYTASEAVGATLTLGEGKDYPELRDGVVELEKDKSILVNGKTYTADEYGALLACENGKAELRGGQVALANGADITAGELHYAAAGDGAVVALNQADELVLMQGTVTAEPEGSILTWEGSYKAGPAGATVTQKDAYTVELVEGSVETTNSRVLVNGCMYLGGEDGVRLAVQTVDEKPQAVLEKGAVRLSDGAAIVVGGEQYAAGKDGTWLRLHEKEGQQAAEITHGTVKLEKGQSILVGNAVCTADGETGAVLSCDETGASLSSGTVTLGKEGSIWINNHI